MSHCFCNVDFVFIIHQGSSFISWHVLLFVLVFALTTFNLITSDLWRPNPQTKDHTWTSELGALSPRSQIARELLTPEGINYWELWHLYTKPSITQLLTASTQDTLLKQQARKKYKNNHQQIGVPQGLQNIPLHTALPKGGRWQGTSPLPTRTQAQVTPNKKSTQTTKPTVPSKDKNQKQKGIQP